jgi:hypothetical protein
VTGHTGSVTTLDEAARLAAQLREAKDRAGCLAVVVLALIPRVAGQPDAGDDALPVARAQVDRHEGACVCAARLGRREMDDRPDRVAPLPVVAPSVRRDV